MGDDTLTPALEETLGVFDDAPPGTPLTTSEVTDRLDVGRRSAYDRLERLAEGGHVETKGVGARGRVWWRPQGTGERGAAHANGGAASQAAEADRAADRERGGSRSVERDPQFRSLVESVEEYAIFMLDPEGRIRSWNEGARAIKGYEEHEVLGEHVATFYTEADREAGVPERNLEQALEDGDTEDEGWRVRKDGSRFWANVTITAVHEDGDHVGYAKVTRDMTERRERERALERERELIEDILETSPVGIGVIESDGTVERVNRRAPELLGVPEDVAAEFVAGERDLRDEDGQPRFEAVEPAFEALETGEPTAGREVHIESEEWSRWLSVNATPITEDPATVDRVVVTLSDVTRLKAQARRLERQRDDLESELTEVFERVDDGFYALDDEFRFTYVNERAGRMLEADDLLGESAWDVLPETRGAVGRETLRRAMRDQEPAEVEAYLEGAETWIKSRVYPSESGLSVYLQDVTERKEREQELERYETIVETVDEGVYVVDGDGTFTWVNPAYAEMTGYPAEELVGAHVSKVVDEDTIERAQAREARLRTDDDVTVLDAEVHTADGGSVPAAATFTMLSSGDDESRRVGVVRDITERKRREEKLEALDDLNGVVRDITEAVIEQSTREQVEDLVCERLAAAGSYTFAWFGDVDSATGEIEVRAEDGAAEYLEDVTITVEDDDPHGRGPTGRAARTGEMQVAREVFSDPNYEPWRDRAREHGFAAAAAIPVTHQGTLFGVLNVYSERPGAFGADERAVVGQLGEVVGHVIASIDRKQALVSDEVVELQFRIADLFDAMGADATPDGTITLDQVVPVGDGTYLVYGTVTDDARDALAALAETVPHWEEPTPLDDGAGGFELRLTEPPVLSILADHGGNVQQARIEDGDYDMTIHLPPTVDVRRILDAVKQAYPNAEMVTRQQRTREEPSTRRLNRVLTEELTDRQHAVLEASVHAGFFEWPRDQSGEEVAESLGISAPTFHQHLRTAQRVLLESLLE